MQSIVEIEIWRPQREVAELFANPRNNSKWMLDVERYEPVSGEQGMPGSTYRLVPKAGDMSFLVTVVARNLPAQLRLILHSAGVDVSATASLTAISPERTRLISDQVFTFASSEPLDPDVERAINAAHRRHMEDFKRFAEGELLST